MVVGAVLADLGAVDSVQCTQAGSAEYHGLWVLCGAAHVQLVLVLQVQ